jgi:predicted HTH transcriptional regulator
MKYSKENLIESVYSIIKKSRNGRITAKQLEKEIGDDKNKVRYALKSLLKEHKVKKVRGLGIDRIEYFYQIIFPFE